MRLTDQQCTPTTDLMRQWHVLADHSGDRSTEEYEAEFDRWLATVEAAAEQRGAVKALREAADWLDTEPPSGAHDVLEAEVIQIRKIRERADQMEGDSE